MQLDQSTSGTGAILGRRVLQRGAHNDGNAHNGGSTQTDKQVAAPAALTVASGRRSGDVVVHCGEPSVAVAMKPKRSFGIEHPGTVIRDPEILRDIVT